MQPYGPQTYWWQPDLLSSYKAVYEGLKVSLEEGSKTVDEKDPRFIPPRVLMISKGVFWAIPNALQKAILYVTQKPN